MDGLELARQLKAAPATRDIPILAVTAHTRLADEEAARAAGCDGYLTKPVDTRALAATVARMISSSGHQTAPAGSAPRRPAVQQAAASLRRDLRPYDAVDRYGGEEFLMVLARCTAEEAAHAAERLRADLSQGVSVDDRRWRVTCSFGIAATSCGGDAEALIAAADAALYRAEENGRNRVEVSDRPSAGAEATSAIEPSGPEDTHGR